MRETLQSSRIDPGQRRIEESYYIRAPIKYTQTNIPHQLPLPCYSRARRQRAQVHYALAISDLVGLGPSRPAGPMSHCQSLY